MHGFEDFQNKFALAHNTPSAIAALAPDDVLIVTKLDRLARSTRNLLNTLAEFAKAGASFRSLGDGPIPQPRMGG